MMLNMQGRRELIESLKNHDHTGLTPFFKLLNFKRGKSPTIQVQYANGMKFTYKTRNRIRISDENCNHVDERLCIGEFYRANLDRNEVSDVQRCSALSTGLFVWDCNVDGFFLKLKEKL